MFLANVAVHIWPARVAPEIDASHFLREFSDRKHPKVKCKPCNDIISSRGTSQFVFDGKKGRFDFACDPLRVPRHVGILCIQ